MGSYNNFKKMVQFSSEDEQSEIKRVLVLGPLGAGKSTVLNVLNG